MENCVIYVDETVVQVLKEDGKPTSSKSRMWVYGSGKDAAASLNGFVGCLVIDGCAGYNQVTDSVRCGCWPHMW